MKKLTRKFKEGFKSYDYNNQDIDILLSLLDAILEMMGIVEMSDHENILKLSSFVRLLSSEYSNTIMEAAMIEEIYDTTIMPILDQFDNQYSQKIVAISSKEIVNGVPHTEVFTDEKILRISDDFCDGQMDVHEYRKFLREQSEIYKSREGELSVTDTLRLIESSPWNSNTSNEITQLNKFITNNKDTDDPETLQVIFNMVKDTVGILHNIYDIFTNGKSREHNEKFIRDLISIRNTMEIASTIDNSPIQLMSDVIRSLCYSLADEIKNNELSPPSSIMMIELKFKSLEDVKYKV